MAIKERKQITGTEAQIKGYAGHNGVLAYATDTKHLHVLSGTAGTTTKLANMSDIPAPVDISGKADTTYVNTELAKKANSSHTHTIANVTGLQDALNAKATTTDLDNLKEDVYTKIQSTNTALGDKASLNHTHTVSQITDMPNVMSAVAQVQADVSVIPKPNAYVTTTWHSGTSWYRVWSDGFIEQGGHGTGSVCNFSKPFSNIDYTFNVQPSSGYSSHPDWIAAYEKRTSRTTTWTEIALYSGGDQGWDWRASGY